MRIHDVSTLRTLKHLAQINWSRQLTFSKRQYNYIREYISDDRGVYCVYSRDYKFPYLIPATGKQKWSSLVYIGSGVLRRRLGDHLLYARNYVIDDFVDRFALNYRCAVIDDSDTNIDYPRAVEAGLLHLFHEKFGQLPPANRRREGQQDIGCDKFILGQSSNFNVLSQI